MMIIRFMNLKGLAFYIVSAKVLVIDETLSLKVKMEIIEEFIMGALQCQ